MLLAVAPLAVPFLLSDLSHMSQRLSYAVAPHALPLTTRIVSLQAEVFGTQLTELYILYLPMALQRGYCGLGSGFLEGIIFGNRADGLAKNGHKALESPSIRKALCFTIIIVESALYYAGTVYLKFLIGLRF